MKRIIWLMVVVAAFGTVAACGSDSSGPAGRIDFNTVVGSGCEEGVSGYYNLTKNTCPAGLVASFFKAEQTGDNLEFTSPGATTLYGTINDKCQVSMSQNVNGKTYGCDGTWTDGAAEMVCDNVDLKTGNIIGTCIYNAEFWGSSSGASVDPARTYTILNFKKFQFNSYSSTQVYLMLDDGNIWYKSYQYSYSSGYSTCQDSPLNWSIGDSIKIANNNQLTNTTKSTCAIFEKQ